MFLEAFRWERSLGNFWLEAFGWEILFESFGMFLEAFWL